MSRFRQVNDEHVPYSALHPERFELPQAYETPATPDGKPRDRAIDHPPEPEDTALAGRRTGRVGFQHLKERR